MAGATSILKEICDKPFEGTRDRVRGKDGVNDGERNKKKKDRDRERERDRKGNTRLDELTKTARLTG